MLDADVQMYFEQGLAPSSRRTYKSALKRFYKFCVQYNVCNPFPLSEKLLCYFAVALAREGLAPQSIKTYLAATRSLHIGLGFPDPRASSSLPILQRIQAGIQRVRSSKDTPSNRVRLPITPPILDKLRTHWDTTENPAKLTLWAVATLCFAGFFRLGELLPTSESQRALATCIQWGDVTVDNAQTPSTVRTHLRRSKCDQFGKGADIYVGKTSGPRCPVVAVAAYMIARGSSPGPFFLDQNKRPLAKPRFIAELKKALSAAGLDQASFAGHSFRIGAATAASQAGLADSTIQTLGRWNSAAFLTYIRTPRHQLASLTSNFM